MITAADIEAIAGIEVKDVLMDDREFEREAIELELGKSEAALLLRDGPVGRRFACVDFVSESAGWRNGKRRAKRRYPREVCLVTDREKGKTTAFHLYPFDDVAREVYEGHAVADEDATEKLEADVRQLAWI